MFLTDGLHVSNYQLSSQTCAPYMYTHVPSTLHYDVDEVGAQSYT